MRKRLLGLAVVSVAMVSAAPPAQDVIGGIRRDVQRIEASAPRLPKRRISLEGFSAEGGFAEVYKDGPRVEKAAAAHYGEMGRTLEDLYFRGDDLIFVYRRTFTYDRPFGQVRRREEHRFYFDRGRLVRWLGPGQQRVSSADPSYAREEAHLLRTARTLLTEARR